MPFLHWVSNARCDILQTVCVWDRSVTVVSSYFQVAKLQAREFPGLAECSLLVVDKSSVLDKHFTVECYIKFNF